MQPVSFNQRERSREKELLDQNGIPEAALYRNLDELAFINKYLGGHAITISGFRKFLTSPHLPLRICEIGSGGGDNLAAIYDHCVRKNIPVELEGIDLLPACIQYARTKHQGKNINWTQADYRQHRFQDPPDIIFSSLFCHHFTDQELKEQVMWMFENCRAGFFINDLHRHFLAFHSIRLLTRLFSRSYLVKNDAPLSVSRAFTKRELEELIAALPGYSRIQWKWAFRWLVTVKKTG